MKKITSALLCAALMLSLACPALAAEQTNNMEAAAAYLREQGVMVGDGNGDMRLGDGLNRAELAVLLTRLHGGPETNPEHYTWACYFTDVPQWAKPYVGYCTATLLVSGYGNQIYGAADPVIPAAACTVILRACGYEDGEGSLWNYNTACSYAASLGLISQSTAKASTITRGEMAVLIYRALLPENATPEEKAPQQQLDNIFINTDGTVLSKTITQGDWSREDFSLQANPDIFTGYYTRGWYNAIRQSIVDRETILAKNNEKNLNPEYLYAHTMVANEPVEVSSAFFDVLGRLSGVSFYSLDGEPYTQNQYEYPGYGIIKVYRSDISREPLEFIQPKLAELFGQSDRGKVVALNSYLCDLLEYGKGPGGMSAIFSNHSSPVLGQCGTYTNAFGFLCEAAGIPCINVRSENHAWNEVYVDGQWLTVDVTYNDASMGRDWYLLSRDAPFADICPDGTRFARELVAPGSTK